MAIFKDGVKMGNQDFRVGLSKKRGQGLMRKLGVLPDDKGRKKFEKDGRGEMQTIRTIVGKGEGFQFPVNYKVRFTKPKGIDQMEYSAGNARQDPGYKGDNTSKVKSGGLDWKTHIMNNSTQGLLAKRFKDAQAVAGKPDPRYGDNDARLESKLDLYCSKVSIPERSITTGLYRQSGAAAFPFPQGTVYGGITTTFYCDGTMHIKNYFDAWQKLIHNDLTGNFNFWDEYTSEFDVFTRTTIADGARLVEEKPAQKKGWADKVSEGIQEFTHQLNEATGVDNPRGYKKGAGTKPLPTMDFRESYGVRIFSCYPQIVGNIDLSHDATNAIATFDVTWAYVKWNPFKMGNIGNRSTVNLSVGEFRNEKDGFPFLEDLPEELSGPLTNAVNQGITTSPLSKASNLLG